MKLTRLAPIILILAAACAPAAPAQPTGGSAPAEQRDEKQSLRVAVSGLIGNLTPQASRTNLPQYWPMYDSLTQFGANYEIKPSVAEKWVATPDGKSWTFTIRKDMTFSNGDKLSAEDVVFSIQEIIDKKWPQTAYLGTFDSVRMVDDATVQVNMKQADASLPSGAPYFWILPKKYYTQVGFDAFVLKPIGSGPYDLVEFRNADQIIYKKRAGTHAFRKPIADDLQIKVIPDATQILNGLTNGEVDIAAGTGWSGDQALTLKDRGMNVIANLSTNFQIAMPQGSFELRDSPLKDKRVRQALNYAINREAIASGIYRGFAQASGQLAVPGSLYYENSVKAWPYDVAQAKKLLADAGYPNGFKLAGGFDYSTARGQQALVVAVQSDLKAVGVDVEVIPNEESVFVDKAYGRRDLPKGDLWAGSNGDDNGFFTGLRTFYGCGKPVGGPERAKLYCNPAWDNAMDAAYGEPDPTKRSALFRQANQTFRDDIPVLYLVEASTYVVTGPKTKGVTVPVPNNYNFDSAYKVK